MPWTQCQSCKGRSQGSYSIGAWSVLPRWWNWIFTKYYARDPRSTVLKHTQARIQAGSLINFNCTQKFLYCLLEMIQHMKGSTGGWSVPARYQVFPFLPGLSALMSCPDVFAIKLIKFHQYKVTSCSPSIPTSICCLKQAKKTASDVSSSSCSSDHQLSENNNIWKAYGPSHKNNKHTNKPSDEFPESAGSVC